MTDAIAAADAAPMPADTSAAPSADNAPHPVVESRPEPTARGAIDRAFAALEAREKGEEPAQQQQNGQPAAADRNPNGTFKAKEQPATEAKPAEVKPQEAAKTTNFGDAPSRFSADAKAAWATAPEPVRAEVTRAIKELETGIAEYKQNFEPYREFDKQIKANGQTFKEVFDHYTGIEQLLARDPLAGLDRICQNLGLSLRQVAAHVLGQQPNQASDQSEATIRELRSQIAELKNGLTGVNGTLQAQKENAALSHIQQFAADKPRFDELAGDIKFFLDSGRVDANLPMEKRLEEAYALAERLNPASAPAASAAAAAQPAEAAQTRNKGQLSPTGAPSSGSNPVRNKPPASSREALDRAFASVGL